MREAKNTARAVVRIGYDGRVHKQFRATNARERFENEVCVLKYLEKRGCDFVPRLLEADPQELKIVTTNCGALVQHMGDDRLAELFKELEKYGVRHDDPFLRNVTYRAADGRFCIIDFEFATILDPTFKSDVASSTAKMAVQPLAFRWSGMTDIGKFRPNNEDAFLAITFDNREFHYLGRVGEVKSSGLDFVFAVSDGMGGEKSGEFASRFAVENITRLLPHRFELSPGNYTAGFTGMLSELFQNIHRQLTKLGNSYQEGRNMGATLSLVWLVRGQMYFAHIGDSRIYHLPADGPMRQMTEDHTYVGYLRRSGQINEREQRFHPRKNVLAQSLGAGNQHIQPQIGIYSCKPGDKFLLCTDGVIDGLWDRGLEELLRDPPAELAPLPPAQRIVRTAVAESGRDNATAVVVEVMGV